jgi:predicted hydrocarbon binding protein
MEKIKYYFDPKKGEALYLGVNSVINQRTTHAYYLKAIEKYMGPAVKIILYNASKKIGKLKFCEMVGSSKDLKTVESCLDYLSRCGYGRFNILKFGDMHTIEVFNSIGADGVKSSKPVCYVTAGVLAGMFELMTGKECYCAEDKCIAKGDKSCTFNIIPSSNKADLPKKGFPIVKSFSGMKEAALDYNPDKGEVFMSGATCLVQARGEQAEFQREFQSIVGPSYKVFMYDIVGRITAQESISQSQRVLIKIIGTFNKEVLVKKLCSQLIERGYGMVEIVSLDVKKADAVIRIKNCYNAAGFTTHEKEAMCKVVIGTFAGGADVVFGRRMSCEETKCSAKGDPYCEFHIFPEEK